MNRRPVIPAGADLGVPCQGQSAGTGTVDATHGNSFKNYGWFWLVIGIILLLSGFLVLQRSQFARWIGIVAAVIAAVGSMAWMPYFPVWALVYVGIAVAVIYALAMYGGPAPVSQVE